MLKSQPEDLHVSPGSFLLLHVFFGQSLHYRTSVFSSVNRGSEIKGGDEPDRGVYSLYSLPYSPVVSGALCVRGRRCTSGA